MYFIFFFKHKQAITKSGTPFILHCCITASLTTMIVDVLLGMELKASGLSVHHSNHCAIDNHSVLPAVVVYVTSHMQRYHFAENKISWKPRKCKFGSKSLIFCFHWIFLGKNLKFHNYVMKSPDSVGDPPVK